ncbi:MAG: MurR/RpiR family transcriptional regulator [Candidatus Fimadaptatus sp.]|jgi:RpiR family carbohydrate utilization transcriptional regulator
MDIDNEFDTNALPAQLLLNMRAIYGQLKRAERSAADLIMTDPARLSEMTIAEAAQTCGVSQPTFVRIARRLGFDGFAQLKAALREAQSGARSARLPSDLYQHVDASDDPYAIASQIIRASIQSMEDLMCVLDREQFNGAVQALMGARRIGFYGVGDAAIVAESAYHKFNRMGAVCTSANDPDVQLVQVSQLSKGDVCVLISHSGRSRTTVTTARRAREMGATVVSITNYPYSPLARLADFVLTTASFMEHSGEVITKRISELVLIESLFISVLLRGGDSYQEALARSNEALVENKL